MVIHLSTRERILSILNKLPVPILDAFGNVLFGRALMVCNSYGIFDLLHDTPMRSIEVAQKVGISAKGGELLLRAMETGGYVIRKGDRYANSKISERWLTKSSPQYLGNLVRYFEALFSRWLFLGETVQRGEPIKPYFDFFSDKDWEIYTYGMMDLARILMPQVLKRIRLSKGSRRLLDLGGSHGLYSIELCRRYDGLTAEVIDHRKAVEVGRTIAQDFGMAEHVVYREGDFKLGELGVNYDVVLAFNIIHGLKPSENSSLMKRIESALNRGGKLFIMDQLRGREPANSLSEFIPVMVGLNLFNEIGGSAYTYEEVKEWCDAVGFVDCFEARLRLPGVAIIHARKP